MHTVQQLPENALTTRLNFFRQYGQLETFAKVSAFCRYGREEMV